MICVARHTVYVPGVKTKRKNHQKPPSPKTTFILKPDDSSQGDGIFLVQKTRDLRHLDAARKIIAQHYIAEPILCDGFKFDLRIYVVVSSVTPLRAHVCRVIADNLNEYSGYTMRIGIIRMVLHKN